VKIRSVLFPLLPAASLLLVACGGGHPATAPAEAAALTPPLAIAARSTIDQRIELAGSVAAARTASVSSRVMAAVIAVHVQLGDAVRAGEVLVSIDPTAARGQLAQAEGALAQANAGLTLAARNHERFQALAAKEAASQLELDAARMQHEQALGAVGQAEGAVAAARSVANEAKVLAPFAGRVVARLVEAGDLAAPGRPLVTIESNEGRQLVVAVPESVATRAALVAGSPISVRLDSLADRGEIAARVAELSPGPDPVRHAFTAKIDLAGIDVAAGAAGRAFVAVGRRESVIVPAAALIESGGLTLVVVRDAEGLAQTRVVTLGERLADGRVEVLSGLSGDESIALGLTSAPAAGTRIAGGAS
jgi:RND family efflux transporter MFP subunit